jgi:hypothetical protein
VGGRERGRREGGREGGALQICPLYVGD